MVEDAHGPPGSEKRVGVLPLVCEAAQRMTLLVSLPLLLVCSPMPYLQCSGDPVGRYV